MARFSATVDVEGYKEVNAIYRLEEIVGTPYALAMRTLYDKYQEWTTIVGFNHPNLFFAESGTLHEGDMRECIEERDGKTAPISVPKGLEPCQAADLFAYCMYQLWTTGEKDELLKLFDFKMRCPREGIDSLVRRQDLHDYVSRAQIEYESPRYGNMVTTIPTRNVSKTATFRFMGSKKRVRTKRVKDV